MMMKGMGVVKFKLKPNTVPFVKVFSQFFFKEGQNLAAA